jgi:hypothetical protein
MHTSLVLQRTLTFLLHHHPFSLARSGAGLEIEWARDQGDLPEISNYLFWDDLIVRIVDAEGIYVTDGPEANLAVTVTAYKLVDLSLNYTVVGPASLCDAPASGTLSLVDGWAKFGHAVCGIYDAMALKFSAYSPSRNETFEAWTIPFTTDGEPARWTTARGAGAAVFVLSSARLIPLSLFSPILCSRLRSCGGLASGSRHRLLL